MRRIVATLLAVLIVFAGVATWGVLAGSSEPFVRALVPALIVGALAGVAQYGVARREKEEHID